MTNRTTAGFYSKKDDRLLYAPNAVHFPDGSVIRVSDKGTLTFPVNGWAYYDTSEAAYTAFGLTAPIAELPEMKSKEIPQTRAERQTLKAQSEAERLAKVERSNPARAEALKAKANGAKAAKENSQEYTSTRANRPARLPKPAAVEKKA